jgi:hypothetical protein
MAKTYTVWVEIEEHDDETDQYVGHECSSIGVRNTLEEAQELAQKLEIFGTNV